MWWPLATCLVHLHVNRKIEGKAIRKEKKKRKRGGLAIMKIGVLLLCVCFTF